MHFTDPEFLSAVIPAALACLSLTEALKLSQTCKAVRAEVVTAWPQAKALHQVRALVVASYDNELLLLNPINGLLETRVPVGPVEVDDMAWPTEVAVDVGCKRCWVSQHNGSSVYEFSLPTLKLWRRYDAAELAPQDAMPVQGPEGIEFYGGKLYTAWSPPGGACLTTTAVLAPQHPANGFTAPRSACQVPAGETWVLWGMRRSPDGALYAAANPEYLSIKYTDKPAEPGLGMVVRAPVDENGQLTGELVPFCGGGHLSRPSGLCFDGNGNLYVTHMGCQVLKYQGPHDEQPGQFMAAFIDTTEPDCFVATRHQASGNRNLRPREHQERLSPDPQTIHPCPMDICWHRGIFYITTHSGGRGSRNHGCLSLWDEQGQLLRAHSLASHQHPNGLAVYSLTHAVHPAQL